MASVGVERLAEPRGRNVRKLRVWAACFSILIALGLTLLAGRPPAERAPFEVYNFASTPLAPVESASDKTDVVAAPIIGLRPALGPIERNIPTTRGQRRNAGFVRRFPARRY